MSRRKNCLALIKQTYIANNPCFGASVPHQTSHKQKPCAMDAGAANNQVVMNTQQALLDSDLSKGSVFLRCCPSLNLSWMCYPTSLLTENPKWKKAIAGSPPVSDSSFSILCWGPGKALSSQSLQLGQEQGHLQTHQANSPWLAHTTQHRTIC